MLSALRTWGQTGFLGKRRCPFAPAVGSMALAGCVVLLVHARELVCALREFRLGAGVVSAERALGKVE